MVVLSFNSYQRQSKILWLLYKDQLPVYSGTLVFSITYNWLVMTDRTRCKPPHNPKSLATFSHTPGKIQTWTVVRDS